MLHPLRVAERVVAKRPGEAPGLAAVLAGATCCAPTGVSAATRLRIALHSTRGNRRGATLRDAEPVAAKESPTLTCRGAACCARSVRTSTLSPHPAPSEPPSPLRGEGREVRALRTLHPLRVAERVVAERPGEATGLTFGLAGAASCAPTSAGDAQRCRRRGRRPEARLQLATTPPRRG